MLGSQVVLKYFQIVGVSLITLTLFDSNPWWKIFLYALGATSLNLSIARFPSQTLRMICQAISAAVLAYLLGLTPYFRTTLGTLIGFTLLLLLSEYLFTILSLKEKKI